MIINFTTFIYLYPLLDIMSSLNRNVVFRKVLDTLKKNPYGLSSTQLAEQVRINRMTLVKYLTLMQEKGLVEYKTIGMAKVWHTAEKYDLMSLIASEEAASMQRIVGGGTVRIRTNIPDSVPLSLFRAMKAALVLPSNPKKTMHEAGQFIAKKCFSFPATAEPSLIVKRMAEIFLHLRLGIITPIQVLPTVWTFRLDESASAHGTKVRGNKLCYFEAGLISGIISGHINKKAFCQEIKCVGEGSAFCEMEVKFS